MKKRQMLMLMLTLTVLFTPMALAQSVIYTEGFEDDAVDSDPTASWYAYTDAVFSYANATDETARFGDHSFLLNSTNTSGVGYADFNLTTQFPYEGFDFWFRIDPAMHNTSSCRLMNDGRTNILCYWNMTNSTVYLNNSDGLKLSFALTDAWMMARVVFNWTADTIKGSLYNADSALLETSAWFPMGADQFPDVDELEYVNITSPDGESVWLAIDGLRAPKHTTAEESDFSESQLLLLAFLGIAIILMVIFMALELMDGKPDVTRLLVMLFATVVLVVALGFI